MSRPWWTTTCAAQAGRHRGRLVSGLSRRELQRLRRHEIGWVAQRPTHSLFPQLNARGQIEQMARLRGVHRDAAAILAEVELSARATARPAILSGGEQQRLAVAAAGVGAPALLIADEPTAELDDSAALVLRLLCSTNRPPTTTTTTCT